MNLTSAVVLLTGASGGIGSATAQALLARGARVLMTGRDSAKLNQLRLKCGVPTERLDTVTADLQLEADRRRVVEKAVSWNGGINVLINNAGMAELKTFEAQAAEDVASLVNVNLLAPLLLAGALLTHLHTREEAHILNVGSVYGGIGYPGYVVYSATKFGVRGFSEALRRELADTNVRVHHLAPRATRTTMNAGAASGLNSALGSAVDAPEKVARSVCLMLERSERERVIGWPETLFVRINAMLSRLVDIAIARQLPTIRQFAAPKIGRALGDVGKSTRIARNSA